MNIIEKVRLAHVHFNEKHPNVCYALDLAAGGFCFAMSGVVATTLISEFVSNSTPENIEFPAAEVIADTVMSTENQ